MKSKCGDPRSLTFSQVQGYEELPQRLKLEELSELARTKIWNVLFASLNSDAVDSMDESGWRYYGLYKWDQILRDKHLNLDNLPLDEWSESLSVADAQAELRQLIMEDPFHKVFDLIQFVLRHPVCPTEVIDEMKEAFERGMVAYVVDDNGPPTIFPACTTAEGQSLTDSLHTLKQGGLSVAEDLFREAVTDINRRDWAGSIKSSIDAAESVARTLEPRAQTFGEVLRVFKRTPALWHPQLVRAMENIWTYTNRAGIRHGSSKLTDTHVGQEEALFMLGTCASIASYLWHKHPSLHFSSVEQ